MGVFGQRMAGPRIKRQAEPERRKLVVSLSAYCPHRPDADTADQHSINMLAATVAELSPRTGWLNKKRGGAEAPPLQGVLSLSENQGQLSGSAAMSVSRLPPEPGFSLSKFSLNEPENATLQAEGVCTR